MSAPVPQWLALLHEEEQGWRQRAAENERALRRLVGFVEDMRLWEPDTTEHKTARAHAYALAESIALSDSNWCKRP